MIIIISIIILLRTQGQGRSDTYRTRSATITTKHRVECNLLAWFTSLCTLNWIQVGIECLSGRDLVASRLSCVSNARVIVPELQYQYWGDFG
jgi:hypothetical protein